MPSERFVFCIFGSENTKSALILIQIILQSSHTKSVTWKSGLASEAVTWVLKELDQNGQVLQNPHEISVNLA